jgi:hypothetical protein
MSISNPLLSKACLAHQRPKEGCAKCSKTKRYCSFWSKNQGRFWSDTWKNYSEIKLETKVHINKTYCKGLLKMQNRIFRIPKQHSMSFLTDSI